MLFTLLAPDETAISTHSDVSFTLLLSICIELLTVNPVNLPWFVSTEWLRFGVMLNDEVLVSFSFTPAVFRALMILFINSEFAANAAFALVLVVSTPNDTVTLSGFI